MSFPFSVVPFDCPFRRLACEHPCCSVFGEALCVVGKTVLAGVLSASDFLKRKQISVSNVQTVIQCINDLLYFQKQVKELI